MSNPLLPREICRFRIENDEIVVWEKKYDNVVVKDFIQSAWSKHFTHTPDSVIEIQWFAEIDVPIESPVLKVDGPGAQIDVKGSTVVAYAYLAGDGPEVEFSMIVHPQYRSQGLGTVMLRMAHDLAIRHHKNVIVCDIPDGALRSLNTFEREGFDFTREGKMNMGRKEIR